MNQSRRGRHVASAWPELLAQWSSSGETAERFAARIGVRPSTLSRWQNAVRDKPRSSSALSREKNVAARASSVFARVQVVEAPTHARPAAGMIELVMRDGLMIRLHGAVDADALGVVLQSVSQC